MAVILGFAVAAIYFYSTSIVNAGLGELFVAVKGTMIVLGTFYVQTATVDPAAVLVGSIIGLLSATVLFVNSFPDYSADKSGGRRTLVIILGRKVAARILPIFFTSAYALIVVAVVVGYPNIYALLSLGSLPLALRATLQLCTRKLEANDLEPAMSSTVMYSRVTGILLALSFLL